MEVLNLHHLPFVDCYYSNLSLVIYPNLESDVLFKFKKVNGLYGLNLN